MARIVDAAGREMEVLQRLVAFGGKRVLDIGCGDGRATWCIARTAASVLGVDPDSGRIELARAVTDKEVSRNPTFLAEDDLAAAYEVEDQAKT